MYYNAYAHENAAYTIAAIYNDGFIQDLLAGTLSKQAVRQYLRADASYLKEFSNLYALLVPKCLQWRMLNFSRANRIYARR